MKKQLLKISACAVLLALFSISFAAHVAPIRTLVIPGATGMVIDGVDDETYWSAEQNTDAFNMTGCASYPDVDFTFTYKVCYTASYLYLFGKCLDDIANPTTDNGATNPWTFDNVEPFIDLDTNGSGSVVAYDSNTIQLRVNRGMDSVQTFGRATRADYILYWEDTSDGWLFEVAVPWKCVLGAGQLPEDIMPYFAMANGFDMSGADSDGVGPDLRDCQTGWDNDDPSDPADRTEDNAWNNRSVFGIVTFGELPPSGIDQTTTTNATVYPNPTSGEITFDNLQGVTSIEIMNLAGQKILDIDVTNNTTVDMSQLASGIYIARVGKNFVKVVKN